MCICINTLIPCMHANTFLHEFRGTRNIQEHLTPCVAVVRADFGQPSLLNGPLRLGGAAQERRPRGYARDSSCAAIWPGVPQHPMNTRSPSKGILASLLEDLEYIYIYMHMYSWADQELTCGWQAHPMVPSVGIP